jgi:hypothetical protein
VCALLASHYALIIIGNKAKHGPHIIVAFVLVGTYSIYKALSRRGTPPPPPQQLPPLNKTREQYSTLRIISKLICAISVGELPLSGPGISTVGIFFCLSGFPFRGLLQLLVFFSHQSLAGILFHPGAGGIREKKTL